MDPIPFDTYVSSLSRLSTWSDPTHGTAQSAQIAAAVASLEELPLIDRDSLSQWIHTHPNDAGVLALIVGLSKEKLKNQVRHWFGVGSPSKVAREKPRELVDFFDEDFDLIRLVNSQLRRTYTFADILNARATTRHSAVQAGESGRRVEDQIEAIAGDLSLPYEVRTRFEGRTGRSAPADLAVPGGGRGCVIAVAAKAFDSTGSKLTDAVREIEEMADARTGNQIVLAVVDGIGWKGRLADLRRIWSLWESGEIDGLFTMNTLEEFCQDLDDYARIRMIKRCPRGLEALGS